MVVKRNRVFNTGGNAIASGRAVGIETTGSVDILDNTVDGVWVTAGSNGNVFGIATFANSAGLVAGNRVRDLRRDGSGIAWGIYNVGSVYQTQYRTLDHVDLRDNDLVGDGSTGPQGVLSGSIGLYSESHSSSARGNSAPHQSFE